MNQFVESSKRLIAMRGQVVTISRTTGGSIDPVTGVTTPGTTVELQTKGILKPYKKDLVDGTRIQKDDQELVLNNTLQPLESDKPVINGEEYTIEHIEEINPAGTPLLYMVQVRR